MLNLPKPSEISMKNSAKGQGEYILSYLKTLVTALEKTITQKSSDEKDMGRYVVDIRFNSGVLKIRYSNGEERNIEL